MKPGRENGFVSQNARFSQGREWLRFVKCPFQPAGKKGFVSQHGLSACTVGDADLQTMEPHGTFVVLAGMTLLSSSRPGSRDPGQGG
ncbi:MAG: hypothetical protein EOM10_17855 [Opitutae bacterium]|nr:hypothetical protein [Opitutae bacterium]